MVYLMLEGQEWDWQVLFCSGLNAEAGGGSGNCAFFLQGARYLLLEVESFTRKMY